MRRRGLGARLVVERGASGTARADASEVEMPKAVWNGMVVAESDATVVVEGNHYFPPDAVKAENVAANGLTTSCPWKGTASYYDIVVGDEVNPAAAWFYPDPSDAASHIKDHVAFGGGITVEA